jgi:hypothetical protein
MEIRMRGPMLKTVKRSTLLLAATWLAACSSPTATTTLAVTLTATPDPTNAVESHGVTYTVTQPDSSILTYDYAWKTSLSVTMTETGGTAVNITAVDLKVQQASGGIVITPSGGDKEYFRFNSSASGNRLDAHGTAAISFDVWYSLPNKGKEALITVGLSFQDDSGNTSSKSVQCKVAP